MPTTTSHLFEVSWEVCNKVGGIYTVITSKLSHATAQFSGHYTSVGPYLPYALGEFSEQPMPEEFKAAAEKVAKEGIIIHYGTWLVEGEPPVILVD
ncbi:MAG: alpha-glucan phosphorylase, partial [Patescibacteria group bacterium]|nr:alpha-glucan phosphorylase [Patescibacteria group bacterium]